MTIKTFRQNHSLTTAELKTRSVEIIKKYRNPVCGAALQSLFMIGLVNLPALAQGPNPFGGSGTTKLANAGGNLMVIGTWLAFFVGLLSFVLIPIFIKFDWDYKKLVMSGLTGLGGFIVMGALAYDIVNLTTTTMPDPTIGR